MLSYCNKKPLCVLMYCVTLKTRQTYVVLIDRWMAYLISTVACLVPTHNFSLFKHVGSHFYVVLYFCRHVITSATTP